jgi:hypothetical protein
VTEDLDVSKSGRFHPRKDKSPFSSPAVHSGGLTFSFCTQQRCRHAEEVSRLRWLDLFDHPAGSCAGSGPIVTQDPRSCVDAGDRPQLADLSWGSSASPNATAVPTNRPCTTVTKLLQSGIFPPIGSRLTRPFQRAFDQRNARMTVSVQ